MKILITLSSLLMILAVFALFTYSPTNNEEVELKSISELSSPVQSVISDQATAPVEPQFEDSFQEDSRIESNDSGNLRSAEPQVSQTFLEGLEERRRERNEVHKTEIEEVYGSFLATTDLSQEDIDNILAILYEAYLEQVRLTRQYQREIISTEEYTELTTSLSAEYILEGFLSPEEYRDFVQYHYEFLNPTNIISN